MRINVKGQVTIPKEIRERAGLLPHTEVEFVYNGRTVRIIGVDRKKSSRGARMVEHLRGAWLRYDDNRRNHGADTWGRARGVTAVLIDGNVLLDVVTGDADWAD